MHDSELAKVEVARVQHDLRTARQSVEQLSSQAATSADREQLIVGEARSELDHWKGRVEVAEFTTALISSRLRAQCGSEPRTRQDGCRANW